MQAARSRSESPLLERSGLFARERDRFVTMISGQTLMSTSRCIDGLLDLYNVTCDPAARRLIEVALSDRSATNAVRADDLLSALDAIDDAALLDHTFAID